MDRSAVMIRALRASQTHPMLSQAYSAIISCDHAATNTGINASGDLDRDKFPTMASEVKMSWGMPHVKLIDPARVGARDMNRIPFAAMTIVLCMKLASKWNLKLIMYEVDAWPEFKNLANELNIARTRERSVANFFASAQTVTQVKELLLRPETVLMLCHSQVAENLYFSKRSGRFDVVLPPPGEPVPDHIVMTNMVRDRESFSNPLSAMSYFYHRISCCSSGQYCAGCHHLLELLDAYCRQ